MMDIVSLSSGYGRTRILTDVSFRCESGAVTTLIGPNGCGKSTLLKTIIGMVPPCEGSVLVDGVSLKDIPCRDVAQRVAYLSQGKNLPDITVERMVLHGRFCRLSYPRKYRREDYEAAREAMIALGIDHLSERPVAELSGGMRQLVYIAMALCQGADVIMLDEPNTYLDISHQMKISRLCCSLAREGKTILAVSHDIISALRYSHRIVVMNEGRIADVGTPGEIIKRGIAAGIFGVDIVPVPVGDETEFCYRRREDV